MRCHSTGCGAASQTQAASAIDYAKFRGRSHDAVIRVYDESGDVIETPSARAISRVVSLARITLQFPLK
jgi:hypothetical protein